MLKMYPLIAITFLATAVLSAEIDPSLTEWKLIERGVEIIDFPLNQYILQIKSYRSNIHHKGDPLYANNTIVDKSTSMLVHYMVNKRRIGQFVWNTIPYVAGTDVILFGCQAPYSRYQSNPCNGEFEQIWSWNFTPKGATLTCFDEVQYEVDFQYARNPSCRNLGSLEIDQLRFTNMAGFYYRAAPVENKVPSEAPEDLKVETFATTMTTLPPTTTYGGWAVERPTCDCWTRECGSCKNLECAVKYDLTASETGVTVTSVLNRKDYNTIRLYNSAGKAIGYFQWNLKSMILEGCIFCRAPRMPGIAKGDFNEWNFSMKDGVIRISVGGEVMYENKLGRGCKRHYQDVQYFAFEKMKCEGRYTVADGMEPGSLLDGTCHGKCQG